jgi:hypothetical protein
VLPCGVLLHADDEVGQWIATRIPDCGQWTNGVGRSIGFTEGPRLIAGASFFRYNGASVEVAFASEGSRWLNRVNLWHLFSYPFDQLKVRRVTSIANASNFRSRKLISALGFSYEATLARCAPDGDQVVHRLFKEDCKWLHIPDTAEALRLIA